MAKVIFKFSVASNEFGSYPGMQAEMDETELEALKGLGEVINYNDQKEDGGTEPSGDTKTAKRK